MRLARGKMVLELGSHMGASTLALAETAKQVHAVDWHYGDPHNGEGDSLHDYFRNTRFQPNIISHVGRFEDVIPALADDFFDLVFIDGYHTREAVERDIDLVLRVLKIGGTLAFHDFTVEGFGVREAVLHKLGTPNRMVDSLAIVELV